MVWQSWALSSTSTFLYDGGQGRIIKTEGLLFAFKRQKKHKRLTILTHSRAEILSFSLMKWWRHVVVPVPGDSLGPCAPFLKNFFLTPEHVTLHGGWWRDHVHSDLWAVCCHTRAFFFVRFLLLLPHDFLQPVASLSAQTANCFSISLISQTIKSITSIIFSKALYTHWRAPGEQHAVRC